MTGQVVAQLIAVVVGGLLAIAGSVLTSIFIERQRRSWDARHLALAFKGEITALNEIIRERRYLSRIEEIIKHMEQTGTPFYMPFRLRFKYNQVYATNVNRIGLLQAPLPEMIPLFYTRLSTVLEDLTSLGDGTFAHLDHEMLVRIYRDALRILTLTSASGEDIIKAINSAYGLKDAAITPPVTAE